VTAVEHAPPASAEPVTIPFPAEPREPTDLELFATLTGSPVPTARAAAKEALVLRHSWVVRWAAGRYRDRGEPVEVLQQIGYIGLLEAIKRFDPERGSDFVSFALPTVLGEIRRYFRDRRRCTRIPRRLYNLQVRIREQQSVLEQRLHRAPTTTELATALDLDEEEVIEAIAARSWMAPASLDELTPTGTPWAELIGTEDARLDALINVQALSTHVAALPERDRQILRMRFYEEMTQTQMAELLGISQMHVSRLLTRTLNTLRNELDSCGNRRAPTRQRQSVSPVGSVACRRAVR
jgi:RNA polymerase sigma-B factor